MPDRHSNCHAPDHASPVDDCIRASSGDGAPAGGGKAGAQAGDSASPAGKRSRGRFTAAEPLAPRAAAGAIAISFAVVAFRNWPQRGI
ncbi:hypothetical protein [Burkholderia plantarii]|uniref:hypothetical protein n=1 Tax=Burkholderia plantarii TaxID=41899 RepID=UPI0018DD3BDE|nr:hypothetical protein [Burkholderia plantarii]MBI0330862.1 hypothetical protein [Burkholderia plantarii]